MCSYSLAPATISNKFSMLIRGLWSERGLFAPIELQRAAAVDLIPI